MNTSTHIRLLQSMPFFGAINDECVGLILSLSEVIRIGAGEFIYHQNEQGDCLYVVESGGVEILKEAESVSVALSNVEAGGCFGELALIACTPRSASARAVEDCILLRIPQMALHSLYQHDPEQFLLIQMNMAREVCRRLVEIDDMWFRHQLEHH